ncbi:MAG: transglycosylase family protein [Jiangellaceae bacterium]|nr:transglycosylase family protein [Jiangellaceae bacterium]
MQQPGGPDGGTGARRGGQLAGHDAGPAAPAGSITEIIYAAAAEYGLSGSYLLSVAACESGLNPSAVNPAGYHGLFQFSTGTWASQGYGSIYDPIAQARTAARMLAAGGAGAWPNCA